MVNGSTEMHVRSEEGAKGEVELSEQVVKVIFTLL